jgi:Ca-activated chloride channel family protein
MPRLAQASPHDAERAYREGKFQKSAEEYERALARSPGSAKLQFNLGAAAYKSGDFAKAGGALDRALHTDRLDLQQNGYYDLGNTLFRMGQKTVEKQPEQTIEQWKKSIGSYESAIKLNPKDADAIYNRDFVKRKLEELERQQKQQQNQQCKNPKQSQQGQQDKKDQQGQQGKQGQQDQKNQQGKQDQQNKQGQQDKKDQQGQQGKQGQQDQKNQQGKQDQRDKQSQQCKQGQQDKQNQQGQQPQPAAANENAASEERETEPATPGKLSKGDAKALLDALRGDERLMPVAPVGPKNPAATDDAVRKDW